MWVPIWPETRVDHTETKIDIISAVIFYSEIEKTCGLLFHIFFPIKVGI